VGAVADVDCGVHALALSAFVLASNLAGADPVEPPGVSDVARAAPTCDPQRAHCVELQLHVVTTAGELVAAPAWTAAHISEARRQFAPVDVAFAVAGVDELPAGAAHVATRRDRDALSARIGGRAIHVFVVDTLDDVDEPGAVRNGVTWRARN